MPQEVLWESHPVVVAAVLAPLGAETPTDPGLKDTQTVSDPLAVPQGFMKQHPIWAQYQCLVYPSGLPLGFLAALGRS